MMSGVLCHRIGRREPMHCNATSLGVVLVAAVWFGWLSLLSVETWLVIFWNSYDSKGQRNRWEGIN